MDCTREESSGGEWREFDRGRVSRARPAAHAGDPRYGPEGHGGSLDRRVMRGLSLLSAIFARRIPRMIHYSWPGGGAPSDEMVRCIETSLAPPSGLRAQALDESNLPADPFRSPRDRGGTLIARIQRDRSSRAVRAWRHLPGHRRRGGAHLRTHPSPLVLYRLPVHLTAPTSLRDVRGERCDGNASSTSVDSGILAEIPRSVEGPAAFEILGPQMPTAVLVRAGLLRYSVRH
jgi:hypothetical protein